MNEQQAMITFVSGLVLACVVAYFAWRNGFKSRQATAATEFRSALAPVVGALLDPNGNPIASIVRNSHNGIVSATESFRPYVGLLSRKDFERRVAQYHEQAQPYAALGVLGTLAAVPNEAEVKAALAAALQSVMVHARHS